MENREAPISPEAVDVAQEPCHHLVFENEFVRVFNVEIPPGETTLLHCHAHDYAAFVVGPAEIEDAPAGQAPRRRILAGGELDRGHAGLVHRVTNTGPAPFRNVVIERKRSSA
jgi:hypothetical protein